MHKDCAQCRTGFEITDDDLAFYDKVSPLFAGKKYGIPPPTLCPDCRNQRRMSWRNDRKFYIRNCDATGERFLSIYHPESPHIVYKPSAWYSDAWDPMTYGKDIDWNRPFFEQFSELYRAVPTIGIDVINCENSDYCNYCGDDKNCYMDIAGEANEDCYYNLFIKHCKNCVDCTFVYYSTLCYESMHCHNSYGVQHSQYLENCSDCAHCFDLKNCRDCIGCINLRNKQYHIFNVAYAPEEYARRMAAMRLDSSSGQENLKNQWHNFRLEKGIYRDMYLLNCEDCFGNDVKNSRNCRDVYNVVSCEDSRFLNDVLDAKDCYDLNYSLYKPEMSYELCSTLQLSFSAFNMACHYSNNIFYSNKVNYSNDLFGCIGLMHKKYCILNKQYAKDEYEALVARLISHMQQTGEWGDFFSVTISPFAYNETVAQEYFPLTKEETIARGWQWREETKEMPNVTKIIPASRLPDSIKDIPDDILNWAIRCEKTDRPFKVIGQELAFYREQNLPVPHYSPDQRHIKRASLRNPRKMWQRHCANCNKSIQTTYAPDRPEKIYCEECYLKKVYC